MKFKYLILSVLSAICLMSCGSTKLTTTHVAYQSVRSTKHVTEIPADAAIAVEYRITPDGEFVTYVSNKTSEIMIIDQQKSLLVNSNGTSNPYGSTQISIAPQGYVLLPKTFQILGLGEKALSNSVPMIMTDLVQNSSYCKFSTCISYSTDNGQTYKVIETLFYANSKIVCPISKHGQVNAALREIFEIKRDALGEEWYLLHFASQLGGNNWNGKFWDYQ